MTAVIVVVDCPPAAVGARMRVAGMSVLERIVREHGRRGAQQVLVRGADADVPDLAKVPPLHVSVQRLSPGEMAPVGATVIPGDQLLGVTITDEASRRAVEWALLQTCRRPYDGPGDKYIGRAISLRVTRLLTRFEITPNQVTGVACGLGLSAAVLAALGTWPAITIAGVLMLAQVIFDSVDGELARVRYMGSEFGMWFDNLSDDVIDNMLVIGLGIGIGGPWIMVGLFAALGRGISACVTYAGARIAGQPGDVMAFRWWFEDRGASAAEVHDTPVHVGSILRSFGRRDTYMLLFGMSCIVGVPQVAFGLGVINGAVYFVLAMAHIANQAQP